MIEALQYARLDGLRDNLARAIPTLAGDKDARAELAGMGLPQIVVCYLNWADRFIRPTPRDVYVAQEVADAMTRFPAVREIVDCMRLGESVNDRLSPHVDTHGYVSRAYEKANPRSKWLCKDMFLNAFDVHHLHLGQGKGTKGKRSNPLLFVEVRRDWAGLILIGDHRSFDDGRLADAVAKVRTDSHEMATIKAPREDQSLRDKAIAQRKGLSTSYVVDGKVILGAMQSLSGGSVRRLHFADRILSALRYYEDQLTHLGASQWLAREGWFAPSLPLLSWEFQLCDLTLFEATSRLEVSFPEMKWVR